MTWPRSLVPTLLAAAALAFGLFAEDQRRHAGRPLDLAELDLLAGLVFVAAGLVVYLRRPTNRSWWLLVAAGASWFLSTLAGSSMTISRPSADAAGEVIMDVPRDRPPVPARPS